MPKIDAPTVVEHHRRQRRALLAAAADILADEGAAAVTPAAVGQRAGLARSSVYQYFSSGAAIIATIVEEAFPAANAALTEELRGITDPRGRIDAYVRTTLRLGAEGAHRVAAALASAELPLACRERLRELHREQAQPLADAVVDLGVPNPDLVAALLGGIVQAALGQVERGRSVGAVTGEALRLIHAGLGYAVAADDDSQE